MHKKLLFKLICVTGISALILVFCGIGCTSKTTNRIDRPEGVYIYSEQTAQWEGDERLDSYVRTILENYHPQSSYQELSIVYPYNKSIFPPEIAAPTFKWIEAEADISTWLLMVTFDGKHKPIYIVCNNPHWTPGEELWESMKQYSVQDPAQITILGVNNHPVSEVVSKGIVSISTSHDEVGAPIMFRRVLPSFEKASANPESIQWCLADISSYEEPPVIMSEQPVCSSCHTLSQDGRFLGMDMDYEGDKGAYFLTNPRENIALTEHDFISWNDYQRTDDKQSTGLYSRISPDGSHIASTVNELFFLVKIDDLYCSQLFFPLQGVLAYYSSSDKKIRTLSGADDHDFVQTDPSWSPDGRYLLFSRMPMNHDLIESLAGYTVFPAKEGETIDQLNQQYQAQFDVYRIPFNDGRGGVAEPVPGASHNGKSNYYARYSPDGKWIVFTQSTTGLVIQPDSKLYIMPATGGEAKMMRCNLSRVNSWHTWSPNSRWLAFVSKENSPYTELFLTHIDENGNDSPPILLERFNDPGYAINVPEFANIPFDSIHKITLKGN